MLKVYSECCKNCLLSKDSIVSPTRRKQIIHGCAQKQTYFICHKSSMEDGETVCSTFYKTLGYKSQMVRIAQRLNMIEFVPQPNADKLPTWDEMKGKK